MLGRVQGKNSFTVGGLQTGQPLWKSVCRVLKKLKINLPYDSAIPLLYKKNSASLCTDTCLVMFISAVLVKARK